MIGHSVIVAVLLTYLHSIDAQERYITDTGFLNEELRKEAEFLAHELNKYRTPVDSHPDYACLLFVDGKKTLCDKIMVHMINAKKDGVFESFVGTDSSLAIPPLVNSTRTNRYKCRKVFVETYLIDKRMYYCYPRRYKTDCGKNDQIEGFFCGGVLLDEFRVYAFRPPQLDSTFVEPVGELIDVDLRELY